MDYGSIVFCGAFRFLSNLNVVAMTGGNRPRRKQQPYRGVYRMLWDWLERFHPQVLEEYKLDRMRFQKKMRKPILAIA